MDKKPIIIIAILCVISLGLGYLSGLKDKESPSKGDNKVQTTEKKEPSFLKQGLVAYYPFNGNAKDESGNGNDGEVKGATLSADRHGKSDNAYSFDGVDDIITVPSIQTLDGAGLTLSAWVNPVSFNTDHYPYIIGGSKLAFYGKGPAYKEDQGRIGFWLADSDPLLQSRPIPLKEWSHVVVISNGAKTLLYWNGQLDDVTTKNVGVLEISNLEIGSRINRNVGYNEWLGQLDDVRIYNRALSEVEVKALYEFEKPKTQQASAPTPTKVIPNNLINDPIVEKEIRKKLNKPTGELTKADLESLTSIQFFQIQITGGGLKEVAELKNLTNLNLNDTPTTDAGLKEVAKLQKLNALSLGGTKITNEGLKEIVKLKNLTNLNLKNNPRITDEGLKEVAKLQQITSLVLFNCKRITDASLNDLAKLKSLTYLNCNETKITATGIAELQKALPNCKIIDD